MFGVRRYRGTTNLLSTLGDRVRGWNFLNSAERAKIRDFWWIGCASSRQWGWLRVVALCVDKPHLRLLAKLQSATFWLATKASVHQPHQNWVYTDKGHYIRIKVDV